MTIQPTSQPVSPLRQRMLDDMATRGLHRAASDLAPSFATSVT